MAPVDVTITYLEMHHPDALRQKRVSRDGVHVRRVPVPTAAMMAEWYATVGAGYHWTDRAGWSAAQWDEELAQDGTELWVLEVDGRRAGFYELTHPMPAAREIQYFGLLAGFEGQGLGAHLLTHAVERAWEAGAQVVTVNTCTLDHPAALQNYVARGFEAVRTRTERREVG